MAKNAAYYRYIVDPTACINDKASNFRLLSNTALDEHVAAIRIAVTDLPNGEDNVEVFRRGNFWLTDDLRRIRDLHPVPMIRINGELKVMRDVNLFRHRLGNWGKALSDRYELRRPFGFMKKENTTEAP